MMAGRDNSKKDGEPVVAALDLGGTKLAAAWLTKTGQVEEKQVVPLGRRDGPAVGRCIHREVSRLRRLARQRHKRIVALGVCVPGIAYASSGRVQRPTSGVGRIIRYARNSKRRWLILRAGGGGQRPGCLYLGRSLAGAAQRAATPSLWRWARVSARGFWWTDGCCAARTTAPVSVGGRSVNPSIPYVACGDFESHASGAGLAQSAARLAASLPDYRGPLKRRRVSPPMKCLPLMRPGTPWLRRFCTRRGLRGAACANLVSLFNPEKSSSAAGFLVRPRSSFAPSSGRRKNGRSPGHSAGEIRGVQARRRRGALRRRVFGLARRPA